MPALPGLPVAQGDAKRIHLHLNRVLDARAIATSHHQCEGQPALPGPVKDASVTGFKAVEAQLQPAQSVPFMWIGACQVVHTLRLEALTHPSMKRNGPGRAGNGNFALGKIEVSLGANEVKIARAFAAAVPAPDGLEFDR